MASGDNKWVVEQMMDIEAPEMVRLIKRLIEQTVEAGSASRPHGRPG
jgi:5,10-methylenetetrahydrofolate reductase